MEQTEELLKRKIKSNRIKIIADVVLIVVLLGIVLYIYSEIENFKALGTDVCRLCEEKTGGQCLKGYGVTQQCPVCKQEAPQINFSLSVVE